MDIQQTAQELQKFSDANGLNVDASVALNAMDAGDFVSVNTAIDNSDNRTLMQLLQKYKARLSEHFNDFSGNNLLESKSYSFIMDMGVEELVENYHSFVIGALTDTAHLTLAEMRTLVYEDITSNLRANQIVDRNVNQQQQNVNPQTAAKMKQANIQRNSNNQNYKVSVPGSQNGTTDVENVVGIDAGPTPQQTLVVTKDNNRPNELSVYGLNDIDPVQNGQNVNVSEETDPNDVMAPADNERRETSSSPMSHAEPSMADMVRDIASAETAEIENVYGDESPLGNEAADIDDEIIAQIMDFCSRMKGK